VTYVFVGAVGFLIGLAAHDLAIQSLGDTTPLRPFQGICRVCLHERSWFHVRCGRCGRAVGREAVLALISAAVALAFLHTVGWNWLLVPYLGFLLLTMALVVTDLEAFRIVDRLNLRGSAALFGLLAVTTAVDGDWSDLGRGVAGGAAYFAGASLLFVLVRGRGFGAGDVKLSVQLGVFTAYLGWSVLGWAVFGTALIGGVVALVLIVGGAASRKTELPYGPPMILGAWTAIVMVGVGAIPIPS
jgi:leader peptidase (prepilin peptidase) / N-methyltransferase